MGEANLPQPLHRARQLKPEDFERFDYILGMDRWNLQVLASSSP